MYTQDYSPLRWFLNGIIFTLAMFIVLGLHIK